MNKSFIDEIVKRMENMNIEEPTSAILVVSNGINLQGFAYNLDKISITDKVDMIAYLLKHMDITDTAIKECKKLDEENKDMLKVIRTIKLG